MLIVLLTAPASAESFSATADGADFYIPFDGTTVEVDATIDVEDLDDHLGDPSLEVSWAELSLTFYDLDIESDLVYCGSCIITLEEAGEVSVDGTYLGDLYSGNDDGYSTNDYSLTSGMLADLESDGALDVNVLMWATLVNTCGISVSNSLESITDITLEGEYTYNQPPVAVANCGSAVADDTCMAEVELDGSGSSDENDDIVSWDWDVDGDGAVDYSGETATADLAIGSHTVTLTVTDSWGQSDTDTVVITVTEGAVEYAAWTSKKKLWPPDHSYRVVTFGVEGEYVCSGDAVDDEDIDWKLRGISSNEPDDAPGSTDGSTSNDIVVKASDTAFLRAERDTAGSGRTYTLELRVYDDDGAVIDSQYPEVVVPLGAGCGACSTGVGAPAGLASLALLGGLVLLRRRES